MSVFAVSKVRLDASGNVREVLWGVVDAKSNCWVSPEVRASTAEVLDAIHKGDHVAALFPAEGGYLPERQFIAITDGDGRECIALQGPPVPSREIGDMDRIDD